jgi:pSer/pThr/pTyr-binding forkhead associated (FHA) protein
LSHDLQTRLRSASRAVARGAHWDSLPKAGRQRNEIIVSEKGTSDVLICGQCHHKNRRDAEKCEKCGARLVTTIPVPDAPPDQPTTTKLTGDVTLPTTLKPETILLSVAGFPQPVLIKDQSEIILGRLTPEDPLDVIDLTKYNAHLLGVSRRHAMIRVMQDKYSLEDLGSANGTWLNENRLEPGKPYALTGGDQIRLGQLIMFIYISTISSVYLLDTGETMASNRRLTPHDLSVHIGPYLQALSDIQSIINEVLGQTSREMGINTISVHMEHCVHIKLDRALETIQLVQDKIAPWKAQHAALISRIQASNGSPGTETGSPNQGNNGHADDEGVFHQAESDLVSELIGQLAPKLAGHDQGYYLQKLRPPLDTLLLSPLEISDSPPPSQ